MATCSSPTVSSGGKSLPRSETGLTWSGGVWLACPARVAVTPAAHATTNIPTPPTPAIVLQLGFMNLPPGPTSSALYRLCERTAYLQNRRAGSEGSAILSSHEGEANASRQ